MSGAGVARPRCECEKCRRTRDDTRRTIAALPWASCVGPVSGYIAVVLRAESLTASRLVSLLAHPFVLLPMFVASFASLFVLKRVADRPLARWCAFVACVVAVAFLIRSILPGLAK